MYGCHTSVLSEAWNANEYTGDDGLVRRVRLSHLGDVAVEEGD